MQCYRSESAAADRHVSSRYGCWLREISIRSNDGSRRSYGSASSLVSHLDSDSCSHTDVSSTESNIECIPTSRPSHPPLSTTLASLMDLEWRSRRSNHGTTRLCSRRTLSCTFEEEPRRKILPERSRISAKRLPLLLCTIDFDGIIRSSILIIASPSSRRTKGRCGR